MNDNLRTRFDKLWSRVVNLGDDVTSPYEELFVRYTEPHRHYHTLDHIDHCLMQVDLARDGIPDADSVEMAIWFHDVIYDPHANDNEIKSAELFRHLARQVNDEFCSKVCDLILITIHPSEPTDLDQKYMVDIDLSSFGMPWDEFIQDSSTVRKEYLHVPETEFRRGQLKFLKLLSGRDHFYYTEFFRSRYEENARCNIERQMMELGPKN